MRGVLFLMAAVLTMPLLVSGQEKQLLALLKAKDYDALHDSLFYQPASTIDSFLTTHVYSKKMKPCELLPLVRMHAVLILRASGGDIVRATERAKEASRLNAICKLRSEEIRINYLMAAIYRAERKRELALEHLLAARRLIDDKVELSFIHYQIYDDMALLHYWAKNYIESAQYSRLAIGVYLKNPKKFNTRYNRAVLMGTYNTSALRYRALGEFDSAIINFKLSRQLAIRRKDKFWEGLVNGNIGTVFHARKQYDSALFYLQLDASASRQHNQWESLMNTFYTISQVYDELNKPRLAQVYYDSVGGLLKTYPVLRFPEYYRTMSTRCYQKGDYKAALEYLKIFHTQNDSLTELQASKNLSLIQKNYEMEKKLNENELLKKEAAWRDSELQRSYAVLLSSVMGLGVIIALALILYMRYKGKIRHNKLLSLENDKLRVEQELVQLSQLKEQVNPHFLYNSLATLKAMIREGDRQSNEFVESLSSVYRYILEFGTADLVLLRDELVSAEAYLFMIKVRFEGAIEASINIADEALGKKLPPFSLQLLIENAVKHNAATPLHPLKIELTTIDNSHIQIGNTLRRKISVTNSTNLGLMNLHKRFKLLGGRSIFIEEKQDAFIVKLPLLD